MKRSQRAAMAVLKDRAHHNYLALCETYVIAHNISPSAAEPLRRALIQLEKWFKRGKAP